MADFGSLRTPNYTNALLAGYSTGREMKRQEGLDQALSGYAKNPNDPNAVAEVTRFDPRVGIQIGQMQQKNQVAEQERRQKLLTEGKKAVGQAALQIATLPPERRAQAWDSAIDYLVGQGWDGLGQFRGKYSDQSLMGVISEAGLANELRTATQPSYQVIPENGTLVDTRNPAAVAQFGAPQQAQAPQQPQGSPLQGGFADIGSATQMIQQMGPQGFLQWQQQHGTPVVVQSPEEMNALPPGTKVRSPDGREGVKR